MSEFSIDKLKEFLNKNNNPPPQATDEDLPEPALIKEVDPELEKLLAEEEAIEQAHAQPTDEYSVPETVEYSAPSFQLIEEALTPPWATEDMVVDVKFDVDDMPMPATDEELPQEEAKDIPDITLNIVNDSDHPEVRNAILEEDGSVTVYLPEGVHVVAKSNENINNIISQGHTKWAAFQIIKVDIVPNETRACKWFTPAREHVENYNAAVADTYKFDRAHKYGSCSNPEIVKESGQDAPPCMWFAQGEPFTKCNVYAPDAKTVEAAYTDNEVVLKLVRTRRNFGLVEYDIVIEEIDTGETYSHLTKHQNGPILVNDKETDWDVEIHKTWSEARANILGDGDSVTDVTHKFIPEAQEKDPYINHVLQLQ